jgi:ABC-type uncharacterized transport system ATPase subunit
MPDRLHVNRLLALIPVEHRGFMARLDGMVNQTLTRLRVDDRRRRVLADALVGRLALALVAEPGVGLDVMAGLSALVAEAERRVTVAEETTLMQASALLHCELGRVPQRLH